MISRRAAWLLVGLLWVVALLNYLDRQVIFSLFPLLREDLRLTDPQLGLISAGFLWVYAFASPFAGYFADRLGHRRVVLFSLVVWSLVTALTGFARSFGELLTARALMGISEAFYIPAALAMISTHHPESTRAKAISLHQSGIYVGIVLGGAGGGWMGEHYGWRSAFYLLGAFGVIYGLFLFRTLQKSPATAATAAPSRGHFIRSLYAIAHTPGFAAVLLVFATTSLCNWLVYTWLPLFLYERFSLSLTEAGFAATFYVQGSGIIGILLGGWVADAWTSRQPRARIWTQAIGLFAAAPFLIYSGSASTPLLLYAALMIYGLGRGIYDSNIMPVLCRLIGDNERATGYGLLNFVGVLVGGLSAYGAGLVKSVIGLAGALQIAGAILLLSAFILLTTPQRPAAADASGA